MVIKILVRLVGAMDGPEIELARGASALAFPLAGAAPEVAVAGRPVRAVLADAIPGAALVRDAREMVVLALPCANPRLRHADAAVAAVVGGKQEQHQQRRAHGRLRLELHWLLWV